MIILLSPSKTLGFSSIEHNFHSTPVLEKEAIELASILKKKSQKQIANLMSLSDKLAELNYDRFQNFEKSTPSHAKQALLAFKGDVYTGFELESYSDEDFEFAQQHIRILSGLYGVLKPMDLIQPYRLEMGTQLKNKKGKNLYEFWGNRIARQLINELNDHKNPFLVNLASNEYFKSLDKKTIAKCPVITPQFKEYKAGKYKIVAIFAKQARGMMANFIIKNKIQDPVHIKAFDENGYSFNENLSNENEWIFTR